jgi:hypothetical protein
MDEDAKTLLTILALMYGSSNGVGLFRKELEPIEKASEELKAASDDPLADAAFLDGERRKLRAQLLSLGVVCYVLITLLLPTFIACVVLLGAPAALGVLGLSQNVSQSKPLQSFYICLFVLVTLSTVHLLSPYLRAWVLSLRKTK